MSGKVTYPQHVTDWIKRSLQGFLGFMDDGALTTHILSCNKEQLQEWAQEMLGDNKAVREFVAEVWKRKTGQTLSTAPSSNSSTTSSATSAPASSGSLSSKLAAKVYGPEHDIYSATTNTSKEALKTRSLAEIQAQQQHDAESRGTAPQAHKTKIKYVAGNTVTTQRNRMMCNCAATQHVLYTNCTACGKIVCEAEGEGACFFCGSMVTKAATTMSKQFEQFMVSMDPVKTKELEGKAEPDIAATTASDAAGLAKAEANRNKLLGYAQSNEHRSRVFDDQTDWFDFESNAWLTQQEREKKAAAAKEAMENLDKRQPHKLMIDLDQKSMNIQAKDAWQESIDNAEWSHQQKKKNNAASSSSTSSSSSSSLPLHDSIPDEDISANAHGLSMHATFGSSQQLQKSVNEMKIISQHQYYSNDTLTGRAKEVYQALKNSVNDQSFKKNMFSASVSSASHPTKNSVLLNSLATHHSSSTAVATKSCFADEMAFDEKEEQKLVDELADGMGELELEEKLHTFRGCANEAQACTHDDDEPTACGGLDLFNTPPFPDNQDRGMCLSLWQPYASLLVYGIKRFEGRGWFTPERGRLWIASGSREVSQEEIDALESEYRQVYGMDSKIPFPKEYPVSSLLGCVDLVNVWSNAEFQNYRAAQGEKGAVEDSVSNFVFVCTNPRVLPLPQRISGQHKLYNLPPKLFHMLGPQLKSISQKWIKTIIRERHGNSNESYDASGVSADERGFDIYPGPIKPNTAPASTLINSNIKPTFQHLQDGVVYVQNALTIAQQQHILDVIRSYGQNSYTGFHVPIYNDGPQLNLKMMTLGMYWDLNKRAWSTTNEHKKTTPPIPQELLTVVEQLFQLITNYFKAQHNSGLPFPTYTPDICIVNYYSSSSGKLGMHMDKDETPASMKAGYPIVSISIGDTAEFAWGNKRIPENKLAMASNTSKYAATSSNSADQYNMTNLSSGDVLFFGGASRMIYHGVPKIIPQTKPRELFMKQGRINLTFRKY